MKLFRTIAMAIILILAFRSSSHETGASNAHEQANGGPSREKVASDYKSLEAARGAGIA